MNKKFLITTISQLFRIDVTYDFSDNVQILIASSGAWAAFQVVDILPVVGNRVSCDIPLEIDYTLTTDGSATSSEIFYGLGDDNTTEPASWISINTVINGNDVTSSTIINVPNDKYLFFKSELSRTPGINPDEATHSITLTDGVPFVCTDNEFVNSITASGSPLNWNHTLDDTI